MKQTWRAAIPVTELSEHPDNPRRGDVDKIAESIDAHGFYGAVLVQESTGHVIALWRIDWFAVADSFRDGMEDA